jgi:hypothetical protein
VEQVRGRVCVRPSGGAPRQHLRGCHLEAAVEEWEAPLVRGGERASTAMGGEDRWGDLHGRHLEATVEEWGRGRSGAGAERERESTTTRREGTGGR